MEQVSIERYIDILRNDTNQWLHIIADTMRAITREVMAHHLESTISDSSPITQRIDMTCIYHSISIRGRGYAFRNSRVFIIKKDGQTLLHIKINNKENYCSIENCRLSKSTYTNGILRDIDYPEVLSILLAVVDELHEDYPDIQLLPNRARLIELTNKIATMYNTTVEV